MMEACVEYDFPEGAVPEMPEVRCYTVDDLTAKYEFVDGVATIVLTKVN